MCVWISSLVDQNGIVCFTEKRKGSGSIRRIRYRVILING